MSWTAKRSHWKFSYRVFLSTVLLLYVFWFAEIQSRVVEQSFNKINYCVAEDDPSYVTIRSSDVSSVYFLILSRPGTCQSSFPRISRFSRPASLLCLFTFLHWLSISMLSFPSMWHFQDVTKQKDSFRLTKTKQNKKKTVCFFHKQKPCFILCDLDVAVTLVYVATVRHIYGGQNKEACRV